MFFFQMFTSDFVNVSILAYINLNINIGHLFFLWYVILFIEAHPQILTSEIFYFLDSWSQRERKRARERERERVIP